MLVLPQLSEREIVIITLAVSLSFSYSSLEYMTGRSWLTTKLYIDWFVYTSSWYLGTMISSPERQADSYWEVHVRSCDSHVVMWGHVRSCDSHVRSCDSHVRSCDSHVVMWQSYDSHVRSIVAGNQTRGSWPWLPVFYHWATTAGRPPASIWIAQVVLPVLVSHQQDTTSVVQLWFIWAITKYFSKL